MSQISATIIADSISEAGQRITTFELVYPRFIHSELMTHRMFSRNAMSSRAVPIEKMVEQVRNDPAIPIHWGKNQSGMQAKEELDIHAKHFVMDEWNRAVFHATDIAESMRQANAHKQIVNRILEPFQSMKTVLTATGFENFFWLRDHEDAQPEIRELARLMKEAILDGCAVNLGVDDWHTPYFSGGYWTEYEDGKDHLGYTLQDALAVSASCCAQVSYRKLDDSLEKAKRVYERLVESKPVHASPFEHQAKPIVVPDLYCHDCQCPPYWEDGVTHVDKSHKFWSGNFKGWIQHRQLIANNVKEG